MKSPIRKLLRLKAIAAELNRLYSAHECTDELTAQLTSLERERDRILASVGAPPLELLGNGDAQAWTAAFVETFPGLDITDVYAWFANAILAGYDAGAKHGHETAWNDCLLSQAAAGDAMAGVLKLILEALDRGIVRAQRIKLDGRDEPVTLAELITEALEKAGRK